MPRLLRCDWCLPVLQTQMPSMWQTLIKRVHRTPPPTPTQLHIQHPACVDLTTLQYVSTQRTHPRPAPHACLRRGTYFARVVVQRGSALVARLQLPQGVPALLVALQGLVLGKAHISQFGAHDIWEEEVRWLGSVELRSSNQVLGCCVCRPLLPRPVTCCGTA